MTPGLEAKRDHLLAILREMGSAAVAFSGGVDSTVVAKAAREALGDAAVAVTADSPSVPRSELAEAAELAARIGVRHEFIQTDEFADADYVRNDGSRCYHCKSELYGRVLAILPSLGAAAVCSGANRDDRGDYRPGLRAAAEHHVRHPLLEADLGKAEVRELARAWGLPNWDKPAAPCLSSRLAPGVEVTPGRTLMVERAEAFLRDRGLRECRVRLHPGGLARVEVSGAAIAELASGAVRAELVSHFRELGFKFITLDLEGFRSGSLNGLVPLGVKREFADRG